MDPTPARPLPGTGYAVHPVGLDGSVFGWVAGPEDAADALSGFVDAGGDLVSTADHYAGGRSEIMIGNWLRGRADRDRLVIATKIGRHPDAPGLARASILAAVDASLVRLQTDRIDVLSFDGDDRRSPLEERLAAFDELERAGKVGALGLSGYEPDRVRELAAAADGAGPRVLLGEYSLMQRAPEDGLLPLAHDAGLAFLARLPLASGYLSGRYRSRDQPPESPMFAAASTHIGRRGTRVLAALDEIAAEHGTTSGVVALAWVLSRPAVSCAIVRARNGAELLGVLPAIPLVLGRAELVRLDAASA
jgi:aryl-alcohol dehydrogenase-like predicted oxidoreductase